MADLLECLLQMKGLGESAPRLLRLTSEAPARGAAAVAVAADTATRLATAERRWLSARWREPYWRPQLRPFRLIRCSSAL